MGAVNEQGHDEEVEATLSFVEEFIKGGHKGVAVDGEDQTGAMVSAFDQLQTLYVGWAGCVSSYRRKLEEDGIPQEEAAVMTRDANWIRLCKMSFPDETPIPPSMGYYSGE